MKRTLLQTILLSALMLLTTNLQANSTDLSTIDNVIYVKPQSAEVGTEATLSFMMKNTAGIHDFQFDLYLPEGVTAVKDSKGRFIALLNSGRLPVDDEHLLTLSEEGDGAIRFQCSSLYEEIFTGNEGEILTMKVSIAETMTNGDYPIVLKNMRLCETDISKYYDVDYVETALKVTGGEELGIATFNLGASPGVSTPEGFFTHDLDGNWNFNSKYTDAEYGGIQFSKGLKMENTTKIFFTTTTISTVTIVQSTWSANTIKFDNVELAVENAVEGIGCRIYTLENVPMGDHVIGRGSGESGLFYVKVVAGQTVTFINDAGWDNVYVWAWNDYENFTGGAWPGEKLTADGEGNYVWSTMGEPTKIIFSDGGGNQTADLDFVDGGMYNAAGRIIELKSWSATFMANGWDQVWAYVWDDKDVKPLGDWPGTQLTLNGGVYEMTCEAENAPQHIIFHNNAGEQTPDWDFQDGQTYEYMQNEYTVAFTTDAGWGEVFAYAWSGDKKFTGDWPGMPLTAIDGVYTLTLKAFQAPEKIQFNGNGSGKTPDMDFFNGRTYKWNTTLTPLYALEASDTPIPAGTTVEVKDASNDVVATLTFGVAGGADFNAPVFQPNEEYEGFQYYTAGNGENGSSEGGTVYAIKPLFDGTVTVGVALRANKAFYITKDGTPLSGFDGIKKAYYSSTAFEFPVKAGSTYKIYCTGSKLGFYGFDYKYEKTLSTYTATFKTNLAWESVYAYAWSGEGDAVVKFLGDWPGVKVTDVDDSNDDYDLYTLTFEASGAPEKIIFSNGVGGNVGKTQTADLDFEDGKEYSLIYTPSALLEEAILLALDDEAVAVGKLLEAIQYAYDSGDESQLQAAIDQFKADNADQTDGKTAKEAYAAVQADLKVLVAKAKLMAADENKFNGKEEFLAAISTAEAAIGSNWYNIPEIEQIITKLKADIAAYETANFFIDFAAGSYYIIDSETGMMMAAGGDFGTHGIVNDMGLDLILTPYTASRTVTIDSRVSNGGYSHFLSQNLFMDSSEWGWGLEYQGFGFYIKDPDSGKYINIDEDNSLVLSDTPREWIIVFAEGVKNKLLDEMSLATIDNPVDATLLITAQNFNCNDLRNAEVWNVSGSCNLSTGNAENRCAESLHSTFTVSQAIAGAPKGTYQLTAQGFYRQDDGYTEDAPVFFIGDATGQLPMQAGSETSASKASDSFTNGLYTIAPITFYYDGTGDLTVGIKGTAEHQWVVFDNFRLTYLGTEMIIEKDPQIYTEFVEATGTLTYYYDNKMDSRFGVTELYDPEATRFNGYNGKVLKAVIDPSMLGAPLTSTKRMFYYLSNMESIDGLENLNTENVTDMNEMFYRCQSLTTLDLSTFDTHKVKDMEGMFENCTWLEILDITSFDVSNVTNFMLMFSQCTRLRTICCFGDWSGFSAQSGYMFYGCRALCGGEGTAYTDAVTDKTYARPDGGTSAPGYFTADTMTGISLTPALSEGEGAIYNLAGQRLSKHTKGINIVGDKKIIVK